MIIDWPCIESDQDWMGYHNFLIKIFPDGKSAMLFAPCRCNMLTEDNLCSIYEDRPTNCRTLPGPGLEEFQPPGCRFFEPVVDSTT
jgi:Fe-S-cluster containining protein